MPAPGHERRFDDVRGTSLHPSIADIRADINLRREGPTADVTKAIGAQLRGPTKRCPTALSSVGEYLLGYRFGGDRLAVLRLQVPVGKAQDLKTAGITDDPEIQFAPFPISGRSFDKPLQARLLFDGSIDARFPATGSGKKGCSRSRPLPVRDLCRVEGIANVVNAGACTS